MVVAGRVSLTAWAFSIFSFWEADSDSVAGEALTC